MRSAKKHITPAQKPSRVVVAPVSEQYAYEGSELAAMDHATHYHAHVLKCLLPATRGRVLELGAGVGAVTTALHAAGAIHITAVEPDRQQARTLIERTARLHNVTVVAEYLEALAAEHTGFDAAIAVNVLEHIADDRAWLAAARTRVRPGGALGLWVPALPAIYGTLDLEFGHVQRYTLRRLVAAAQDAGWQVQSAGRSNILNIPSWWWLGHVTKATTLSPRAVAWYDRWIARWWLPIERRLPLPIGNNCWLVAINPST